MNIRWKKTCTSSKLSNVGDDMLHNTSTMAVGSACFAFTEAPFYPCGYLLSVWCLYSNIHVQFSTSTACTNLLIYLCHGKFRGEFRGWIFVCEKYLTRRSISDLKSRCQSEGQSVHSIDYDIYKRVPMKNIFDIDTLNFTKVSTTSLRGMHQSRIMIRPSRILR